MRNVVLVVAVAENGVIGQDGRIPWHISDDLRRFKALTLGQTVVMGRKTWDSLPRKPLPGRTNIVVTRQSGWQSDGATAASSLADAIHKASGDVMVIGGGDIYRQALPLATRIELTEVHRAYEGDAFFTFDRNGWIESHREDHVTPDGLGYCHVTLERAP
ncbi:MAG TPA: dihydrofolate reductase [Rhizomicrobium sp.]|nr:dihydrofolate reductase [Rhizomicrobium sp.]